MQCCPGSGNSDPVLLPGFGRDLPILGHRGHRCWDPTDLCQNEGQCRLLLSCCLNRWPYRVCASAAFLTWKQIISSIMAERFTKPLCKSQIFLRINYNWRKLHWGSCMEMIKLCVARHPGVCKFWGSVFLCCFFFPIAVDGQTAKSRIS